MPVTNTNINNTPQSEYGVYFNPEFLQNLPPEDKLRWIWYNDPQVGETTICDWLYFRNEQTRFLLGKAVALQQNYLGSQISPKKVPRIGHRNFLVLLAGFSTARMLIDGLQRCYCPNHACAGNVNCVVLSRIFAAREDQIKCISDRMLQATYGTSDMDTIKVIRIEVRAEEEHRGLCKHLLRLIREYNVPPKGKKARLRRVILAAQIRDHQNTLKDIHLKISKNLPAQ